MIHAILCPALIAGTVWAAVITGVPQVPDDTITGVPEVTDGDTIRIGDIRIRLAGIDAPETAQACINANGNPYQCGLVATAALEDKIAGRSVDCIPVNIDHYGRQVALCSVNGDDLGEYMVRSGNAIDYVRYDPNGLYSDAQQEAVRMRRGIWSGHFEEPEQWRRAHPL